MKTFIDKISVGRSADKSLVKGYSEAELEKISRLYDIHIEGDLKDFMVSMGRCSGGLLGDDVIVLYHGKWGIRGHLITQTGFRSRLVELKFYYGKKKPFLFSSIAENLDFFMLTNGESPYEVYCLNDSDDTVVSTGLSFLEYMQQLSKEHGGTYMGVTSAGDMLNI
ncbi:MAG: hypothetical protein MI976_08930 [Pseudomonadales bacterium]|nr:hypothetical protein [Pseudomonadales bacterium]